MSRITYINGSYIPHKKAYIHVEDRGYQFSDGVYEVYAVWNGQIIDEDLHQIRLERSLSELSIALPFKPETLKIISKELLRRNKVYNGIIYLQITRGVATRDHSFPNQSKQSVVMTTRAIDWVKQLSSKGEKIVSLADMRWKRRDIKSISLLPNVMAAQKASISKAYEAWLIDEEGFITEGSSSNAWIIDKNNQIITRDLNYNILGGVTRLTLLRLAQKNGFKVLERSFSIDEAKNSNEAFLTSTTSFVKGVINIDGSVIGDGRVGRITSALSNLYLEHCSRYGDTS